MLYSILFKADILWFYNFFNFRHSIDKTESFCLKFYSSQRLKLVRLFSHCATIISASRHWDSNLFSLHWNSNLCFFFLNFFFPFLTFFLWTFIAPIEFPLCRRRLKLFWRQIVARPDDDEDEVQFMNSFSDFFVIGRL